MEHLKNIQPLSFSHPLEKLGFFMLLIRNKISWALHDSATGFATQEKLVVLQTGKYVGCLQRVFLKTCLSGFPPATLARYAWLMHSEY